MYQPTNSLAFSEKNATNSISKINVFGKRDQTVMETAEIVASSPCVKLMAPPKTPWIPYKDSSDGIRFNPIMG